MSCVVSADVAIVAHRGASAYAPENTLPAFELAWKMEADAIEGDFRLTADGQIVCIHDADTKRVSGQVLEVESTDYATLKALNVGGATPTHIPLLSEVLDTVPAGKRIVIEVKSGVAIVPHLVRELEAHALPAESIFIISFDVELLSALKEQAPQLETGLLINFKRSGLKLSPSSSEVFELAEQCQADAISVKAHPMLSARFCVEVRERGYGFHVWTVDEPRWAAEMVKRGAQSITTNKPDLMRAKLK